MRELAAIILFLLLSAGAVSVVRFVFSRTFDDKPKPKQPDPTKLCIYCDHMKESGMMYLYCEKSGDISLVNGKRQNQKYCSDCRADEAHCGPSGKFFSGEKKIKERLAG